MRPEIVLGVDLGTSFSTAAAWVNGKLYLVPDYRGEACIPSVVYFPADGAPVVGAYADRMRRQDPLNTVAGVKRILGRRFEAPEVKVMDAHSAVKIVRAPSGLPLLKTPRGEHTPVDVATIIFRHLRELAERRFGLPIRHAVITVPAAANPEVEEATVRAARAAGLEVLRTLSEPVAGAIAYRLDGFTGRRRVLVYDFGGGTFDATVLEQDDARFRPICVGGDACLGGDDLDHALAHLAAGHVFQGYKVDLTRDVVRWDRLVREVELTKRALSAAPQAPLRLRDAFVSRGRPYDLDLVVERTDVEPRWRPLVERTLEVSAETLVAAELRPDRLDGVLLVGGSTYVPMVRAAVERVLGKAALQEGDPQTAVATGAALIGARAMMAPGA